jgi:hypothetical protein
VGEGNVTGGGQRLASGNGPADEGELPRNREWRRHWERRRALPTGAPRAKTCLSRCVKYFQTRFRVHFVVKTQRITVPAPRKALKPGCRLSRSRRPDCKRGGWRTLALVIAAEDLRDGALFENGPDGICERPGH